METKIANAFASVPESEQKLNIVMAFEHLNAQLEHAFAAGAFMSRKSRKPDGPAVRAALVYLQVELVRLAERAASNMRKDLPAAVEEVVVESPVDVVESPEAGTDPVESTSTEDMGDESLMAAAAEMVDPPAEG